MQLAEWLSLSADDREAKVQDLDPYRSDPLFAEVEREFRAIFGSHPAIIDVFCGQGSGLGPYNALFVKIARGHRRLELPRSFLGFRVVRQHQRKDGSWRF